MNGGRKYTPLEEAAGRARDKEPADQHASAEREYVPLPPLQTDLDADIARIHSRAAELKAQGAIVGYELAREDTERRLADDRTAARAAHSNSPASTNAGGNSEQDADQHNLVRADRSRQAEQSDAQPLGKYDSLRADAAGLGEAEMTDAQRERLEQLLGREGGQSHSAERANPGAEQGRSDGGRGRSR